MNVEWKQAVTWALRLVAAIIMLQTLYFKFTASEESVYIFSTVGMEPWGRVGSGIAELIASILILIPRYSWKGAIMGLGVISGAIFFHITKLGIVVKDDGGQLFIYALLVFFCCAGLLIIYKNDINIFINKVFGKRAHAQV